MPQLPPRVRGGRGVAGWIGLVLGLSIAAVLMLALGIVLLAVALAAWIVRGAVWLVLFVWAWLWFGIRRLSSIVYPFALRAPITAGSRSLVLNGSFLRLFAEAVGLIARMAAWLFSPLALLASLVGTVLPVWRARPYLAVFSTPALVVKLIGLGRRRGYFADGNKAVVVDYDAFLQASFPQISRFIQWWRDPDAPRRYTPGRRGWLVDSTFAGLTMGAPPDPFGVPGLAATAMRRREIRGLRELLISQREIDDLGDPDLDDRGDVAVIRVVSRVGENGIRLWVVQLPSTQVWHPRSGQAPNDLTADLVALSMRETTLTRAALAAMKLAAIGPDDHVMLAGFSLGGLVAAQLAERCLENGFTVTHLVTAGAPIGRYAVSPHIRVLSLEHLLDPVPRVDGRENPVRPFRQDAGSAGGAWITIKAGPPLPLGYRISMLHHSPSYAETAGLVQDDPPDEQLERYLHGAHGALSFFGPGQSLRDFAATRASFSTPQAAVPVYLHSTVQDGITRTTLKTALRRVAGVIAVDIYQSRTGFPTTILWNADVLVRSLRPWFEGVERAVVYRGLLSLLKRRRAIGIHFRLQAKESPGVTWEATVQRMTDGRWREQLDVTFDTDAAEAEWLPLLLPDGWASTITYYPADAFGPLPVVE